LSADIATLPSATEAPFQSLGQAVHFERSSAQTTADSEQAITSTATTNHRKPVETILIDRFLRLSSIATFTKHSIGHPPARIKHISDWRPCPHPCPGLAIRASPDFKSAFRCNISAHGWQSRGTDVFDSKRKVQDAPPRNDDSMDDVVRDLGERQPVFVDVLRAG
jgi:hypothetical protein